MGNKNNKKNIFFKIVANIFVRNILAIVIIAFCLIFLILHYLSSYTKHGESIPVPSLVGLQVPEAVGILGSSELKYEISDSVYRPHGIPGSIIDQIPIAKSNVKKGRIVYLTIQMKAIQSVRIPDLANFSKRQAVAQLNSIGFSHINILTKPSHYQDIVLNVICNGQEVKPGQKMPQNAILTLVVGAGGIAADQNQDAVDSAASDNRFSSGSSESNLQK